MQAVAEQNPGSDSLWETLHMPVRLLTGRSPSCLLVSVHFATEKLPPEVAQHGTLNLGTGLNLQLLAAN